MIVNVRGTFGSGKSTVVRRVMEKYAERRPVHCEGRKQPFGYQCIRADHGRNLWVVGHYETACGGTDTIPKINVIYEQVNKAADLGYDVIYEGGALVAGDWRRAAEAAKHHPFTAIILTTPIEVCLDSIRARRAARGDDRPLNPDNTVGRYHYTLKLADKLAAAGVTVRHADREEAFKLACEVLLWT